ncbi:MAG: hypothetical protein ACKPKO_33440 [Candidatus Fonsibacter sp.]
MWSITRRKIRWNKNTFKLGIQQIVIYPKLKLLVVKHVFQKNHNVLKNRKL